MELVFRGKTHKAKNVMENENHKKFEMFREPPEKAIEEKMEEKVNKDS